MSSTEHGPNRRTVLKGAAWTAPAIVVATAAPAFAASQIRPAVTSTTTSSRSGSNVTVSSTFTNAAAIATTGLIVTYEITPLAGSTVSGPVDSITGGWTASTPTFNGAVMTVVFTKAAPQLGAAPSSVTLGFRFNASPANSAAGTVRIASIVPQSINGNGTGVVSSAAYA